jgi:peptidoglycan/LPS O-acetylase OafA/YrhL
VTLIPFALLIPAAATSDLAGRPNLWRSRWMIWLGETSFAFYLLHRLVLMDLIHALHAQNSAPAKACLIAIATLVLSLSLSGLLHRYIETPLTKRLGRPRSQRLKVPLNTSA